VINSRPMPDSDKHQPPPKEVKLQVRIDAELAALIAQKAQRYGGVSAVVRALLRRWAHEDIVTADDVLAELARAPQKPARKRKR
jgi:hypothetical protein